MTPPTKHSCTTCARRKVKCDKLRPCSNCLRSQRECIYRAPAPSQRHRKRPADEDLLSKISEYEHLLRRNNVQFQPLDNSWIPSPLEEKLVSRPRTLQPDARQDQGRSPSDAEWAPEAPDSEAQSQPDMPGLESEAARLWYSLPKEVCDGGVHRSQYSHQGLGLLEKLTLSSCVTRRSTSSSDR